jgi:hypothetical protein
LGGLAALLAAVVGVPLLLEAVAGSPIPTAIPAWDGVWASLIARDDGTLLLGSLKYAAWAGWALFVLSVVADVVTRVRGLPVPRLGPQQQLATQLVGAVLALAVSVPTAMAATAAPAQPASGSQPAGKAAVNRSVPLTATTKTANTNTAEQESFEEYRVRRGDCLWDIAWNELGEPERWPEIYQASRSVRQPDGRRLTDPDLIVTGWVLHIPTRTDGGNPERALPSRGKAPPDRTAGSEYANVATPFFGPARSPHPAQADDRRDTMGGMPDATVATPLTPVVGLAAGSAIETRWRQALQDPDRGMGDSWRGG